MKNLLAVLLLSLAAFGQTAPVTVTKANSTFTWTLNGNKAAVLIVGDLVFGQGSNAVHMAFVHESLYNKNLIAEGMSESFNDPDNQAALVITFVQYADGTTWGDPNGASAQQAQARRKAGIAFFQSLSQVGTENDFLTTLNAPQTGRWAISYQNQLLRDVHNDGASVVWATVKAKYANAQSRSNLWNF